LRHKRDKESINSLSEIQEEFLDWKTQVKKTCLKIESEIGSLQRSELLSKELNNIKTLINHHFKTENTNLDI